MAGKSLPSWRYSCKLTPPRGGVPVKCVDTILRLLLQSNGHAVLLRASQIPLMMTGTAQSPLPMEPLSVDQMGEILTEIVPLSVRARLRETGSVDYTVP